MLRTGSTFSLGCLCGLLIVGVAQGAPRPRPRSAAVPRDANIISPSLCFTIKIPGDWHAAEDAGTTYRSSDGKQFVEVLDLNVNHLKRYTGNTLVEKEAAALVQSHEKAFRRKLTDMTLAPFESAVPGTWKWTAAQPDDKRAREFQSPKRYLVDLSPEGIIVLNIQKTPDDDELARRIIATLRHSKERPCQLPRSVEDLMASAGIRPSGSAKVPPPALTYNSTRYGWSVSYPKGWNVDDSKPEFVQIRPADKSGLCGIHTIGVESKFKTTEAFADFMLSGREKDFGGVKSLLRQPAKLPSGLSGIESLADIQAKGRSHQLFVVTNGAGYVVDCETEIPNWGKLAPSFEQVISSFSVPNLTALTEADTAPARTFVHPQHHWSIAYPGGWRLDASDPDNVSILRPDSFAYSGCGIHSKPGAQYSSLDDFADTSLRRNAESQQKEGVHVRATSRKNISLPNGVTAIEVEREMKVTNEVSGNGRSRVILVLTEGMGYILDCQTDERMWDTLAPTLAKIVNSFTLERKP